MPTLLTPFSHPSSSPALLLPTSASPTNGPLTLSYTNLSKLVHHLREQLDQWQGPNGALKKGDTVSMSLGNGVEFSLSFLGVGAHR